MASINDILDFNPKRTIRKGEIKPFIEMAALPTESRDVIGVFEKKFKGGGSKFCNGDTLFARITPCLENGKTAKVNCLEEEMIGHGSTEFIVMSAIDPEYDEDFVYYIARLPEFRQFAQARMEGTSGRQRVSWQALSSFPYEFPEKDERRRIGEILRSLDDKIEINNQINKTLEEMAQAIFKSWFVDFEPTKAKIKALEAGGTEDDAERAAMTAISGKDSGALDAMADDQPEAYAKLQATAKLFPAALADSDRGPIPEGWDVKPLDEIAHYQNGLALQKFRPKDETDFLPVVKIAQLKKGVADGEEKASPDIKESCIIDDGDVIFSWSGSLVVDLWCGGKAALNQHLFKVTSAEYPKWFYLYFTKHHLNQFQRIAADKAVTMGHIKREHLSAALCSVPDTPMMELASSSIASLLQMQINQRIENKGLAQTRDTFLPKLLSGKINLSEGAT